MRLTVFVSSKPSLFPRNHFPVSYFLIEVQYDWQEQPDALPSFWQVYRVKGTVDNKAWQSTTQPHQNHIQSHWVHAHSRFLTRKQKEKKKQGSSIAVSRPVNFLQGAHGSHTFSHMANWVWILWAELFWDSVRRKGIKKKLTVCGKTEREEEREMFWSCNFSCCDIKKKQAQSYGLSF